MKIKKAFSPHFGANEIPVEFLVLHYTACSLEDTLRIFADKDKQVCSHFVLDTDGTLFDLGGFWEGAIRKGAHAGVSNWAQNGKKWEGFNQFSVGIEIVNFNGNILPFTDLQYESLAAATLHLAQRFPALQDPERVVGHEHIAGFRGKVDPGICFDWGRFFRESYPEGPSPSRSPKLTQDLLSEFEEVHGKVKVSEMNPKQWSQLSAQMERYFKD